MSIKKQDRIPELKAALPDIPSCTPLKKESDTSLCGSCLNCGGTDRFVYRTDTGKGWCRQCHEQPMDVIDFHCWLTGKSITDLIREYLPDATQEKRSAPPRLTAQDLLCTGRGLSEAVVEILLKSRSISVANHAGKQSLVAPFKTLQGETQAIQYLSLDQKPYPFTVDNGNPDNKPKNKVWRKGDKPGSDNFFIVGPGLEQAKEIILVEGIINALSAYQWYPEACCIALGGSTYTRKVKALKPHIDSSKTVYVAQDNDPAGEKMLEAIKKNLGRQDVYFIDWIDKDKPGMDINDFLQKGQSTAPETVFWVTQVCFDDQSQNTQQSLVSWETHAGSGPGGSQRVAEALVLLDPAWEFAAKRFPKTGFPWEVLPSGLTSSLKQLARSCACSPTHLPGIAFGILAAVLGRHVEVIVKASWSEPLIFWFMGLLPSGQGKTPAQNALSAPIYVEQENLDAAYKKALDAWKALPVKERDRTPKPENPGGIITTDMTIEGLRFDQRLCGGMLLSNDEASGFFTGQNQYKSGGRGTDRESLLKLYDGHPTRVVRTSGTVFLKGARISIIGGTQPGVFWRIFKNDADGNDIFLVDGTLFRFMMTYEGEKFFPMGTESWDESNQAQWNHLIQNALIFCQKHMSISMDGVEEVLTHQLRFSEEALNVFVDWVNDLKSDSLNLPEQTRGFIPKMAGWCARLAGIIKCLESFLEGTSVPKIIEPDDLRKGIRLAEFYMGHNVDVIKNIVGSATPSKDVYTDQEIHLAKTLQNIKGDIDSGRLAVGFIWEKFNENCPPELQYENPRAFGGFIRSCNLTVSGGKHNANGKRAVNCLEWDKTTDSFIETRLQCLQSLQTLEGQGSQPAGIGFSMSAMSAGDDSNIQALPTVTTHSLQAESLINNTSSDITDEFSGLSEENTTQGDTDVEYF